MPELIGLSIEQSDAAMDAMAAHVERGLRDVASETAARLETEETVTVEDLNIIQALWLAYVTGTLLPFLSELLTEASSEQLAAFTTALRIELDAPVSPGVPGTAPGVERFGDLPVFSEPVATEDYLNSAQNRLVGIGDELWNNARTSLAEGLAEGESMPKLAARVREAADVTEPRARVIARTEAHGARQTVAMATTRRIAAESGAPGAIRKQWQATEDLRTRPTHHLADGQTVDLTEPFQVGTASLAFPGDPSGPPGEIISCRCVSLSVIDVDALRNAFVPETEMLVAAADDTEHTGAMIALAPTETDAQRLAIDGYEDVAELHLTLAYLGDAADWTPEQQAAAVTALRSAVEAAPGPIEGDAFGVNHWNPNGDEPCWVLGIGGDGLDDLHSLVWDALLNADTAEIPENHTPWIPHVCLAYTSGVDVFDDMVDRSGPIMFDRLRIAFGDENTYIPLGGALTADAYQGADDMPWSIVEGDERCDAGEFAVVKDEDNELEGCHATRDDAEAQLAALYASEDEAGMAGRNTVPWSGVLLVEGSPTGDGRQFAYNALTWPELGATESLEIPLGWKYERAHGGMDTDKVVTVGRIDHIERLGNEIHGRGVINLDSEWGREAARQMGTRDDPGFLAGVSIDADDPERAEIEYQFPSECALDENGYPALEDGELPEAQCMMPEVEIYHSGRIRAATLVDIPAFVEARLYLDESMPETMTAASITEPLTASAYTITIPDLPPAEWFSEPTEAPQIGAITVTDDGRIFGYLAPKHVAHRGIRDKRVEVPMKNVDYGIWMNRVTLADDGTGNFERVATGPITMDCGHAPTAASVKGQARREHYDNACSVVATVRAGENRHGVWISGALLPGVTADQVTRMMACQLSGDWGPHREQPGKRELAAALLVPVPGFPRRAYQSVNVRGGHLSRSVTPLRFGTWERQHEPVGLPAAVQRIAESVGLDPRSQMRAFAAGLDAGKGV